MSLACGLFSSNEALTSSVQTSYLKDMSHHLLHKSYQRCLHTKDKNLTVIGWFEGVKQDRNFTWTIHVILLSKSQFKQTEQCKFYISLTLENCCMQDCLVSVCYFETSAKLNIIQQN
jgi:hypothetical protein